MTARVRPDRVGLLVTITNSLTTRGCRSGGPRADAGAAGLLELLYACCLHSSEAVGLKVHEANLEAGYVTVLGKGGKERVPLGQHARDAITEYLAGERPRLLAGRRCLAVPARGRAAAVTPDRLGAGPHAGPRGSGRGARPAAPAEAHVRHPSPRRRRRPARCPGAPRARRHRDDPGSIPTSLPSGCAPSTAAITRAPRHHFEIRPPRIRMAERADI